METIKLGIGTVLMWVVDGSVPGNATVVERGATAFEDLEGMFEARPPVSAQSQEVDQGRLVRGGGVSSAAQLASSL